MDAAGVNLAVAVAGTSVAVAVCVVGVIVPDGQAASFGAPGAAWVTVLVGLPLVIGGEVIVSVIPVVDVGRTVLVGLSVGGGGGTSVGVEVAVGG